MQSRLLKITSKFLATLFGVLICVCATPVAVAQPGKAVTIDARDIKASALLLEIAKLDALDMVVANRAFDVRLSIHETFASPRAAIDAIVSRARLKSSRKNEIWVIADHCTPELPADSRARTASSANPFADARVSLNFQQTDLAAMLSMLQMVSTQHAHVDTQMSATNFSANTSMQIGVHIKTQSARRAYEAIAAATGTGLMATTGDEFIVSQLAAKKGCNSLASLSADSAGGLAETDDALSMCPRLSTYPATADVGCQPLEFYKFSDIAVRGYLKYGNELVALVETQDQLSWAVGKTDLLGENFARIEALTDKGLVIKEMFINRYGYPFDRKLFLSFDGKQSGLPD